MTDVRLTALNPEDSKVYPVACNSSGELLTDKAEIGPDISIEGNLDVGGSATAGSITSNGITQYALPPMGGGGQLGWDNDTKSFRLYANSSTNADAEIQFHFNQSDTADIRFNQGGSATFAKEIVSGDGAGTTRSFNQEVNIAFPAGGGGINIIRDATNNYSGAVTTVLSSDGSATFAGDVVIGSRGSKWLIRESNGVAMLVEQTRRGAKPRIDEEEVRDLPRELDLVEAALNEIMEKLKMTPPAGWPVWDGETETE